MEQKFQILDAPVSVNEHAIWLGKNFPAKIVRQLSVSAKNAGLKVGYLVTDGDHADLFIVGEPTHLHQWKRAVESLVEEVSFPQEGSRS